MDAGVTTLIDYDHNIGAPEFADAAIRGTADAGVRSVYCYGMAGVAKEGKLFESCTGNGISSFPLSPERP